jgi:amidase
MHTHFDDYDWQAARERYKESTALPSSLLVPSLSAIRDLINETSPSLSSPGPSLSSVIAEAGVPHDILSPDQREIIHGVHDATDLIEKIKSRIWTISDVTEAHLRMAAIAQQALGCYSSIFFDAARARAKDLDRKVTSREDVGKLCGLPISVKAHIGCQGTGSDRGYIFDVLDPVSVTKLLDEEEKTGSKGISKSTLRLLRKQGDHLQTSTAKHIEALLDEGAIIIAKTVMPQSVMQLE